MVRIYDYLDYRSYLKERFVELKATRRGISHRALMQRAGFSSPNFLKLVMDGTRNLSESSIPKIAEVMGLKAQEADFFAALVRFNQAKHFEEKDEAYRRLSGLRRGSSLQKLESAQFHYFRDWYAVAIRELVLLPDFREDPEWIVERLKKAITPAQAKQTLKLLEELKLLQRNAAGRLHQTHAQLSAGDAVRTLAVRRFQQTMISKALDALEHAPADYRDITGSTFAISPELLPQLRQKIRELRHEILDLANRCPDPRWVYQLNVQLFNLSELV